tara:strand:- start:3 stop:191 length:189 start_codon:yes stop_codon:yes gene_type:complete
MAMKKKGYARGAMMKMKKKGMARGGAMMKKKGYSKGGSAAGMTLAKIRSAAKSKGYKLVKMS